MCGRFASITPPETMRQMFGTRNLVPNFPARFNLAPTQDVLAVRFNPETRERSLDPLRWGLIPHWAKDQSMGVKLINARAEGIADKPSFRDAFRRRRCIIPADAFYEWKAGTKPKRPHAVRRADHQLMALAGLWENWKAPDGQWVRTCTIITTAANTLVAQLHDRMPVILPPEDYGLWLGEEPATTEELKALLTPFQADQMEAYPVGFEVSKVASEGSGLLEPAGDQIHSSPPEGAP